MPKVIDYDPLTAVTDDDALYVINDADGTPGSRYITCANFRSSLLGAASAVTTLAEGGYLTLADGTKLALSDFRTVLGAASLVAGTENVDPSGDATGATDLANIQAAADSLAAAGGGQVVLTPGDFTVSGTIVLPWRVGIRGTTGQAHSVAAAADVTITHNPASTANLISVTEVETGYGYIGPIQGLRLVAGTHSNNAIYLPRVAEFLIQDCALMNFTVGVKTSYTLCSVLERVYIEGTYVGGSYGLEILAGVGQSTTVEARSCRWRRHEYPLVVNTNACHSTTLSDCIFESCTGGIAYLRDGHTKILNAYTEEMSGGSAAPTWVNASGCTYELTFVQSVGTQRQDAPAAIADGDTAITLANLQARILTMASSTSGRAPTVPTGTVIYGTLSNPGIAVGQSLDWTFINTGNQTVTITAAEGHTLVGNMAITAGTQKSFRTRCTGENTAETYGLT